MPRKLDFNTERHHVHLYEGDWDKLQMFYGTSLGASGAIRAMVRIMVKKIEARSPAKDVQVDLDEIKLEG